MLRYAQNDIYLSDFNDVLKKSPQNNDPIYLVQQFFIHSNKERYKEIKYCLKQNIQLPFFEKIILLNEKIYSKEELGLNDQEMTKILQIDINKRLKYSHVFEEIQRLNLQGYITLSNSDIFFDKSIENIRRSCLSTTKSIYALLRFEFKGEKKLGYCKLFTFGENHPHAGIPRYDSQDTWIYHTSQINANQSFLEKMDILLGMPGCDNVVTMRLSEMKFNCFNVPWNVKSYHNHRTQIRNYGIKDVLPKPYLYLKPIH